MDSPPGLANEVYTWKLFHFFQQSLNETPGAPAPQSPGGSSLPTASCTQAQWT